jgi:hypothetical protein
MQIVEIFSLLACISWFASVYAPDFKGSGFAKDEERQPAHSLLTYHIFTQWRDGGELANQNKHLICIAGVRMHVLKELEDIVNEFLATAEPPITTTSYLLGLSFFSISSLLHCPVYIAAI